MRERDKDYRGRWLATMLGILACLLVGGGIAIASVGVPRPTTALAAGEDAIEAVGASADDARGPAGDPSSGQTLDWDWVDECEWTRLPGWGFDYDVDQEFWVRVSDDDQPEDEEYPYHIVDIETIQADPDVVELTEWREGYWHFQPRDTFGDATFLVTYTVPEEIAGASGVTDTYVLTVHVVDAVYGTRVYSDTGSFQVLPGQRLGYRVDGWVNYVVDNPDYDEHDPSSPRYREEYRDEGFSFAWRLGDGAEDFAELAQDEGDRIEIHAKEQNPYEPISWRTDVTVEMYDTEGDANEPVAIGRADLTVSSDYLEIEPLDVNPLMDVGTSLTIVPELKHHWISAPDGDPMEAVVEVENWEWMNPDEGKLRIEQLSGNSFKLTRLSSDRIFANLGCSYRDGDEERRIDTWYAFLDKDYRLEFDDDHHVVYDVETGDQWHALPYQLTDDMQGLLDTAELRVTVGIWEYDEATDEGSWVEEFPDDCWRLDGSLDMNGTISVDGTKLQEYAQDYPDDVCLRAQVVVPDEDAPGEFKAIMLGGCDAWIDVREAREDYGFKRDRAMIPGWEDQVDRWCPYWVDMPGHQDEDGSLEITNVEVRTIRTGEDNQSGKVVEVRKEFDEDRQNWWWRLIAKDYGEARVSYTYIGFDNVLRTGQYTIWVRHDVYWVDAWYDDSNQVLPGQSVTLHADGRHETDYDFDHESEVLTYEWVLDEGAEGWASIVQDANDPRRAVVTFDPMGEDEGYRRRNIDAIVRLRVEGDDDVLDEARVGLAINSDYYEVWPVQLATLELGDSVEVTPELRHYAVQLLGGDSEGWEPVAADAWNWAYDHNCLSIEETSDGKCRITRLGDWDTEFSLQASFVNGGGEDDECWGNYHLDQRNYNLWLDCDDDRLYSDGSLTLTLGKNDIPDDQPITYTVGVWDDDAWVATFDEGTGVWSADGDILTLDGAALWDEVHELGYDNVRVVAEARKTVGDEDLLLAEGDRWIEMREVRVEYDHERYEDLYTLPGWEEFIPSTNHMRIDTAEHPDEDGEYQITGVQVVDYKCAEDNLMDLVVSVGDDDEGQGWDLIAEGHGWAKLRVTYRDANDEEQTYEFTITVTGDVYGVDLWHDGSNKALPGQSIVVHASGWHDTDHPDDEYDAESFDYVWGIADGEEWVEAIVPDEDDPSTATVTFVTMPENRDHLWEDVDVTVHLRARDASGNLRCDEQGDPIVFAEETQRLNVGSDYYDIWPAQLEELEVGERLESFVPELRRYALDFVTPEDEAGYRLVEASSWCWEDYDDNCVRIEPEETGADPSFTITRLGNWDTNLRLAAYFVNDWGDDERCEAWYHLNRKNYPVRLTTANGNTVFSDATLDDEGAHFDIEYDGVDFNDLGYGVAYEVHAWGSDFEETPLSDGDGYYEVAPDATYVRLNGKKLREDGVDELRVRIQVVLIDHHDATYEPFLIGQDELWVDARDDLLDYDRLWSRSMIPGWWQDIEDEYYVEVRNTEYPDGLPDPFYQIDGVEVQEEHFDGEHGADDHVITIEPRDGGGWRLTAGAFGWAKIRVTYTDLEGQPAEWEDYVLTVEGDVYGMFLTAEDTESGELRDTRFFPGSKVTICAEPWHVFADENQVDQDEYCFKWRFFGDESLVAKAEVDPADDRRFNIEFKEIKPYQDIWRDYGVEATMFKKNPAGGIAVDESGHEIQLAPPRTYGLSLGMRFHELHPLGVDPYTPVNAADPLVITPELRRYNYGYVAMGDSADRYEVREDVTYGWEYDEAELLIEDNGDGTWTITRLTPRDITFNLVATTSDGTSFYRPLDFEDLGYDYDLSNATVTGVEDKVYNGEQQTQEHLTVTIRTDDGLKTLTEGEDYVVHVVPGTNVNVTDTAVVIIKAAWDDGSDHSGERHTYGGRQAVAFRIEHKPVTVTAADKTKTYGESDPELTATVDGLIDSDTVEYQLGRALGQNVGTYAITPAGDEFQGNYRVSYFPATFTINPASARVEARNASKRVGEDDPELHAWIWWYDDEAPLNFTISREPGEEVGEYVITVTGDEFQGNYRLEYSTATFTILPAATDIATATFGAIPTQNYAAQELTPKPVVTLGDRTLAEGTDYELEYEGNVGPGTATVTVTGKGEFGGSKALTFSIRKVWLRIAGQNALDTMKEIAKEFGKTNYAVVTTNASFKDALAASALAGRYNALVLTTAPKSLSAQTKTALTTAKVTTVFVVGGTGDISANTFNQLKKVSGIKTVKRVGSGSASAKAIALAKECGKKSDTVIIATQGSATQGSFKDALSIAPYSYATKSPILYAESNKSLSAATLKYIKDSKFAKAIIVGGTVPLPKAIDTQLSSKAGIKAANITRLAGVDSYATSEVIARWAIGQYANGASPNQYAYIKFQPKSKMSANKLAVAVGHNWKDALCGAALVGKNKSVLLLADDKGKDHYTWAKSFCGEQKAGITRAYVFGGTSAITNTVWNELLASTKL